MSFTQTDDVALPAVWKRSQSAPAYRCVFFLPLCHHIGAGHLFKGRQVCRSGMCESVFLLLCCQGEAGVISLFGQFVRLQRFMHVCLWSQSLRHDPAVPTPTVFSGPFLFFFFLFSRFPRAADAESCWQRVNTTSKRSPPINSSFPGFYLDPGGGWLGGWG